jgi:hypothetical protein
LQYAWARAIRSPFGFVTSGGYHSTIGKVIGNQNIVLENIEYSTIRMHIELAREPNIHPKPIVKVQIQSSHLGQIAQQTHHRTPRLSARAGEPRDQSAA